MAIFRVPTQSGVPSFTQRTSLDGRTYLLSFRWNERQGAWYLSIADQDGSVLMAGRRLVIGTALLRRQVDARAPAGELILVDVTGEDAEPGLQDLGARAQLMYLDAAEIAEVRG